MNYLAHVYLARHSDDAMLGGLLGDFVGPAALGRYSAPVQREILMHRKIDSYTDAHPAVREARALFPEGRRRYAGIALDVYFDHLIARDWAYYHDLALDQFNQDFYRVLLGRLGELPERLQALAPHIAGNDWFGAYRDRDNIDFAISRIATRLSRNGEKLVQCLPILREHETVVTERFSDFFPELVDYVDQLRAADPGD